MPGQGRSVHQGGGGEMQMREGQRGPGSWGVEEGAEWLEMKLELETRHQGLRDTLSILHFISRAVGGRQGFSHASLEAGVSEFPLSG